MTCNNVWRMGMYELYIVYIPAVMLHEIVLFALDIYDQHQTKTRSIAMSGLAPIVLGSLLIYMAMWLSRSRWRNGGGLTARACADASWCRVSCLCDTNIGGSFTPLHYRKETLFARPVIRRKIPFSLVTVATERPETGAHRTTPCLQFNTAKCERDWCLNINNSIYRDLHKAACVRVFSSTPRHFSTNATAQRTRDETVMTACERMRGTSCVAPQRIQPLAAHNIARALSLYLCVATYQIHTYTKTWCVLARKSKSCSCCVCVLCTFGSYVLDASGRVGFVNAWINLWRWWADITWDMAANRVHAQWRKPNCVAFVCAYEI